MNIEEYGYRTECGPATLKRQIMLPIKMTRRFFFKGNDRILKNFVSVEKRSCLGIVTI
jgi:hypothetical protein